MANSTIEKEYIVELRVTVDTVDIERYGGIENMIDDSIRGVPFSFEIEDCREIQ